MTDNADALQPAEGRLLALWFALGTALFTLVNWMGAALWPDVVSSLVPRTTYDQALSFPWVIGLLVVEFGAVYGAILFTRRKGAPRWVWLPLGALSAWAALWGLVQYAVMAIPAASADGVANFSISFTDFASSVFFALSPLIVIALPAMLACLRTGHADEPLLGDFGEQPRLFAATGLVILAVGLPLAAFTFGWLADVPAAPSTVLAVRLTLGMVVWNLLVPALVCWAGTKSFRLPRAVWMIVAAGTLAPLLGAQTPGQWFEDPAAAMSALVGSVLLALLTTGAAILGAWLGTREQDAQSRPAV